MEFRRVLFRSANPKRRRGTGRAAPVRARTLGTNGHVPGHDPKGHPEAHRGGLALSSAWFGNICQRSDRGAGCNANKLLDGKSVVWGKSGYVRVDTGGRGQYKEKK